MPKNKKIKGLTVEIGGDTTKLGQSLDRSKSISTGLQKELREVNRLLKGDPNDTELLAQKQKLLSDRVGETKTQLDLLKDKQGEVNKLFENGEIGEEDYRAYQREVKNTQQTLDRLQTELDKTSEHFGKVQRASEEMSFKTAESNVDSLKGKFRDFAEQSEKNLKRVSDKLGKIGSGMQTAGSKLTPVSAGAAGVLGAGVKLASDFEDEFAFLTTLAKEDGITYEELKKQIIQLSNDTGIDAATLTRNTYDTISAGQETKDAVDYLRQAVGLSKAGKADVSNALDILTTITNAYEMESKQAGYINDILIQTQNLGKTTVGDLSQYMGKVIPTAKSFNVQLNQLGSAYAIMTSKGIATADSTTYINSLLSELGKSGTAVSKIIKDKTGKSFSELMENGATLGDVLAIIDEKAKENNKSFADLFKKTNSAKAATALFSGDASKFNGVLKEMDSSSGAATKALSKLDTNSAKVKKTVNELKNVGIELGSEVLEQAKPLLTDALNGVKGLTEWMKKLNPEQKQALVKAIEIFAVLGPGLTTVGKMTSGISNLAGGAAQLIGKLIGMTAATEAATVAQEGLNVAQSTNPIGAVIMAVTGLIAIIGALAIANQEAKDETFELSDEQKKNREKVDDLKQSYDDYVTSKNNAVKKAQNEFNYYDDLWDELQGIVDQNGKIKEGYEKRAKFITDKLGGYTDQEIKINDGVIQSYKDIKGAIEDAMTAARARATLSALASSYSEAIENKNTKESERDVAKNDAYVAYEKWKKVREKVDAEYEKFTEAQKKRSEGQITAGEYNKALERYEKLAGKNGEYMKKALSAWEDYQTAKKKYETLSDTVAAYARTIDYYEKLTIANAQGNEKEINSVLELITNDFITAENGTRTSLENQTQNIKTQLDLAKMEYSAGLDGITQDHIDKLQKRYEAAQAEEDKYNETHKQTLEEAFAYEIDANSIEEERQKRHYLRLAELQNEHNDLKSRTLKTATDSTRTELQNQVDEYEKHYQDVKRALENGEPGVTKEMVITAKLMVDGAEKELKKLPGKVETQLKKAGEKVDESKEKAHKQGENFVEGFINGILDGMSLFGLGDNVKKLAKIAINTLAKEQDSHSPSKETKKLGGDFGEGYSLGIAEKAKKAGRNSAELAQAALEALNAANSFGFSDAPQPQFLTGSAGVQTQVQIQQIDAIMGKIDILTKAVQSLGYIRLNDDTLVGATADKYDSAIGQIALRKERGW